MRLKKVTITGADDSTPIEDLIRLSTDFPFVEWGILVSAKRTGESRYPSRTWIDEFSAAAGEYNLHTATHVCGRWAREIFAGYMPIWDDLPSISLRSNRIQINGTPVPEFEPEKVVEVLLLHKEKTFILQASPLTRKLIAISRLYSNTLTVLGLFDRSGGMGVLPGEWPKPENAVWDSGYAGGLGPDNVDEQVRLIEAVVNHERSWFGRNFGYWIDMESGIRTPDDSALDLKAVETVLEKMSNYMTTTV